MEPMIVAIPVILMAFAYGIYVFVRSKRAFEQKGGTYKGILSKDQEDLLEAISGGLGQLKK